MISLSNVELRLTTPQILGGECLERSGAMLSVF
jgi:hypothetical protein